MLNALYHFATPWAKATKRQINVNRMLGVAANALYPIYCAWSPLPKQRTTQGERMVVSLTTFPLRIGKVHLTIQSILRQSRPADRILLWLSKEEFPEEAQLPANLLRLKEKGLDIRFCDNIRSFKKVFYTAQEFENDVIVTADDDALYPENWLEGLWDTHEKYPGCVCCSARMRSRLKAEGWRLIRSGTACRQTKKDLRKHFFRWTLEGCCILQAISAASSSTAGRL